MVNLYNNDCLEQLKEFDDNSIDAVVTDPPYNIGKAAWDKIPNYIEWCGQWIKECERVLKSNGSFYFFHSDMPQIAQLMEWIRNNTAFEFKQLITWNKTNFKRFAWTNRNANVCMDRNWFPNVEYCLYYTFQDGTGLEKVKLDVANFQALRQYFYGVLCFIGLGLKGINSKLGHRKAEHAFYCAPKKVVIDKLGQKADHCFRYGSTQWDLPTPETYQELIDKFNIDAWDGFRPYESLRQEYESLRYVFNLNEVGENISCVWESSIANDGRCHPTQKPQDIMQKIIKASSNKGDTILDCFMGSGSTAIAAIRNERNFIGIERDAKYFELAKARISKEPKIYHTPDAVMNAIEEEQLRIAI